MNIPTLPLSRRPSQLLPGVVASAAVVACGIAGCDEPPPDRTAVRLAERVTHDCPRHSRVQQVRLEFRIGLRLFVEQVGASVWSD